MTVIEDPIQPPDMTGVKPGSPEERALHKQYVEQRRAFETGQHEQIVAELGAIASDAGVVPVEAERAIRHGMPVERR